MRCFGVKQVIKKIEQIQKRCLEILYNEPHISLEELLNHYQGISFHRKHIDALLPEICQTFSGEDAYFTKKM